MTVLASLKSEHITRKSALLGLLFIAPVPTIGVWFAAFEATSDLGATIWAFAKVWLLIGPVLWWRLVQRQPLSIPKPDRTSVWLGMSTGTVLALIIIGAYWFIGRPFIDFSALADLMNTFGLDNVPQYLGLVVYLTLVNSLIEEYVFRWFMQKQLTRFMPGAIAVLAAAAIFTLHHTVVLSAYIPVLFNVLASLGVFTGALIWSWLYYRTGNLWSAYISHIGADIGVFVVGYLALFSA